MANPPTTPPSGTPQSYFQTPSRRPNQQTHPLSPNTTYPSTPSSTTSLPYQDEFHPTTIPTTSFSPSKARAQARQTHQLTIINRWLTSLTPPSPQSSNQTQTHYKTLITRYESEHQTLTTTNPTLASSILKALQDLMFANQSADETRTLLHAAELEELTLLSTQDESRDRTAKGVLNRLYHALDSKTKRDLDTLAESAVLLGVVPSMSSSTPLMIELGEAVTRRTIDNQRIEANVAVLTSLQKRLQDLVDVTARRVQETEDGKVEASLRAERMQMQTAQWSRETKQILMKIQEYKDRIVTLERMKPRGYDDMVRIEDVVEMQDRVDGRREVVRDLEERLRAFHGLPPDLEASRQEVRRAKMELERLKARREELFEQMADR